MRWGWRPALLLAGIATVMVVTGSGWIFRRTRDVTRHVSTLSLRSIPAILRDRSNLMMFIAGAAQLRGLFSRADGHREEVPAGLRADGFFHRQLAHLPDDGHADGESR